MDSTVEQQLNRVVDGLVRDFAGRVPEDAVRTQVRRVVSELGEPKVTQYVPVLVYRSARAQLRGMAVAEPLG